MTSGRRRPGAEGPSPAVRALLPSRARLDAEVVAAERALARRPGGWTRLEALGRGLRAVGRPGWRDLLLAAIEARRALPQPEAERGVHIGNLLLLAGDEGGARHELEAVVDELGHWAEGTDGADPYLIPLLAAAFLLERDDVVERIGVTSSTGDLGAIFRLTDLAAADRRDDGEAATELTIWFAARARREVVTTSGAAPSLWDMTEIAAGIADRCRAEADD